MQRFTFHRDQLAEALKNLDEFTAETRRDLDANTQHPVGFYEARMATRVELNAHVIAASRSLLAVLSIAMRNEEGTS